MDRILTAWPVGSDGLVNDQILLIQKARESGSAEHDQIYYDQKARCKTCTNLEL